MAQVQYGHVSVDQVPCCCGPPVEFHSEEGKRRRRKLVKHYGNLSLVQLPIALLAVLSGATTVGLAIPHPSFPFLSCFPFANGLMILIAALFARRIARANLDDDVPSRVKRNVVVHYVLCIIGCSTCGLAATVAGVALSYCYSDDPETFYQCLPLRDVKLAFTIVDIVGGALLFPTCIAACVLFCLHSQTLFGSQLQRFQTLEAEVSTLRAQVAALSQAHRGVGGEAPPAYSERPPEGVTNTPQGGGAAYEVSLPDKHGV